MRWMLARIMALNLLSLYTLIFALFGKTDTMINQLAEMKKASAAGANYGLDLGRTVNETQDQNCFKIPISCEVLSRHVDEPDHKLFATHFNAFYFPEQILRTTLCRSSLECTSMPIQTAFSPQTSKERP